MGLGSGDSSTVSSPPSSQTAESLDKTSNTEVHERTSTGSVIAVARYGRITLLGYGSDWERGLRQTNGFHVHNLAVMFEFHRYPKILYCIQQTLSLSRMLLIRFLNEQLGNSVTISHAHSTPHEVSVYDLDLLTASLTFGPKALGSIMWCRTTIKSLDADTPLLLPSRWLLILYKGDASECGLWLQGVQAASTLKTHTIGERRGEIR